MLIYFYKSYQEILFENLLGTIDLHTYSFAEFGDIINWETLFIIRGKVEQSFGVCSITVNKIASLKEWVSKTRAVGFS